MQHVGRDDDVVAACGRSPASCGSRLDVEHARSRRTDRPRTRPAPRDEEQRADVGERVGRHRARQRGQQRRGRAAGAGADLQHVAAGRCARPPPRPRRQRATMPFMYRGERRPSRTGSAPDRDDPPGNSVSSGLSVPSQHAASCVAQIARRSRAATASSANAPRVVVERAAIDCAPAAARAPTNASPSADQQPVAGELARATGRSASGISAGRRRGSTASSTACRSPAGANAPSSPRRLNHVRRRQPFERRPASPGSRASARSSGAASACSLGGNGRRVPAPSASSRSQRAARPARPRRSSSARAGTDRSAATTRLPSAGRDRTRCPVDVDAARRRARRASASICCQSSRRLAQRRQPGAVARRPTHRRAHAEQRRRRADLDEQPAALRSHSARIAVGEPHRSRGRGGASTPASASSPAAATRSGHVRDRAAMRRLGRYGRLAATRSNSSSIGSISGEWNACDAVTAVRFDAGRCEAASSIASSARRVAGDRRCSRGR